VGGRGGGWQKPLLLPSQRHRSLVQILTKEVQKQSESISELQGTLGSPGKGGTSDGDSTVLLS